MNAVIKPQPCPCCEEKDREIAQLKSIITYADVRTNDLVANGPRQKYTGPERRHALRVQRDAEKAAK